MRKRRVAVVFLAVLLAVSFLTLLHVPDAHASSNTRVFTSLTYDGYCEYHTSTDYETVHDAATADARDDITEENFVGQGLAYYIYRSYLYFDTSLLPDNANITSVVLSIYISNDYSYTDFNVTVQSGQPTYPHIPLQLSDYYYGYYTGNGGSRNTSEISGAGYWNITLNSEGRSWIQTDGITKLCLRSSRDINSQEPTQGEYIIFYAREKGQDYAPKLYVTYEYEGTTYVFYGPFNEKTGTKEGNITVWVYPASGSPYNFTLDGEETIEEEQRPLYFRFNLSEYNFSRFYAPRSDYEEIYVFVPEDPYFYYSIDLIDLVGVSNGYFETYITVNSTSYTIERRQIIHGNKLPFIFTWGWEYGFRVVCDQGTYDLGHHTPLTEQTITVTLSPFSFPSGYTVYENITLTANRTSNTQIVVAYEDSAERTNYVNVTIYRVASKNKLIKEYSTQQDTNTLSLTWKDAEADKDYIVKIVVNHADYGTLSWSFNCHRISGGSNPWDFDFLGTWPVDSSQIIGFAIVMCVFACFSVKDSALGLFVGIVVAAFLVYIGWLAISWTLVSIALCLAVFYALSRRRT